MGEYTVKNVSARKIELENQDGKSVGYLDFHEGVGSLYLDYVFVEPEHRGEQVGVEIVKKGIELALEKGLKPKPICGYASTIMKRNNWPEDFNG